MNSGSKRGLFLPKDSYFRLGVLLVIHSMLLQYSAAQSVGFNNAFPDASSIIDAAATDRGVLIPRMTTAQRNAISSPANGLLVYDTDFELFYFNSGTSGSPVWVPINSGFHASKTRIKILPNDFMATADEKGGSPDIKGPAVYDTISSSNFGVITPDDSTPLVAFVVIPTGYQATHARIYGNDTGVTFDVFVSDIETGILTSIGSANVGSEADITDTQSTTTNFLVIIINFDTKESDKAYGGYVTIAPF